MIRKEAHITQILALLLMLTLKVASYAASPAVIFADTAFYNHYSYICFVSGDSIAAPTAEDFLDRADELTGCNCVFGDFMSDDDMIVDGFDLKYTDPDDIFCSLWNLAWQCYDGHPKSCDIFHDILYGFAA